MILFDSNILIYSSEPARIDARAFIAQTIEGAASHISLVEVLGFSKMSARMHGELEKVFEQLVLLPITEEIIYQAVKLRRSRSMSLGDSIIASTALVHSIPLVTNNEKDFSWIDGLSLINPIK